jgi:hypothetical protein
MQRVIHDKGHLLARSKGNDLSNLIIHDHCVAHDEVLAFGDHFAFCARPRGRKSRASLAFSTSPAQACSRVNVRSPLGLTGTVAVEKITAPTRGTLGFLDFINKLLSAYPGEQRQLRHSSPLYLAVMRRD